MQRELAARKRTFTSIGKYSTKQPWEYEKMTMSCVLISKRSKYLV